jgi:hypothetical protein
MSYILTISGIPVMKKHFNANVSKKTFVSSEIGSY